VQVRARSLKLLSVAALCLVPAGFLESKTATGTVSHRISGCNYFLVRISTGYDLLEWYGGHDPDKGDTLIGNYESYGFPDIVDETANETGRVYTERLLPFKNQRLGKANGKV
jgi:hypothetical protein